VDDQLWRKGRDRLAAAATLEELEDARVAVLGRSSALTQALRALPELPPEERKGRGAELNRVRASLEGLHAERREAMAAGELERRLRPGLVVVGFEGEEASAVVMAERLVYTLEVWVAAIAGQPAPLPGTADLPARFERAARAFARLARRIHDRGAFDDAFVDALCEPPQSFTYGSVLAHVLTYGAIRREALAGVLAELGADVRRDSADPILWEQGRAG
jgi:hypothetical protein